MNAVIIYWSKTGNTEKVAMSIKEGLEAAGVDTLLKRAEEAEGIDFFEYDLVCVGMPSYQWHPPGPMDSFLKNIFNEYRKKGRVKLEAPPVSGKNALIFCTYSGPHTGVNEAIPAGKYTGQFFEHLGFTVLDEWYILSEFHGAEEFSTKGRMGDIRGKPTEEDLKKIRDDAANLVKRM
jgi:flavodoxin